MQFNSKHPLPIKIYMCRHRSMVENYIASKMNQRDKQTSLQIIIHALHEKVFHEIYTQI